MKHQNAVLLKKELQRDPRWAKFVKQANRTKLETTQTCLAFLNPPSLKTNARSMNLDTLVRWGCGPWLSWTLPELLRTRRWIVRS